MHTFESLGLSPHIVKALSELGITTPTPIQEKAIPALLEEAVDFLGLAQTGTGKTAAFGLPLIEQIDPAVNAIQAVVLSPTRELAQQIAKAISEFARYAPEVSVSVVYGGANISGQIKELKTTRPKILVATPGRLIDFIDRKVLNLSNVRYVVLDEADEMLNMGFKDDIDVILSFTQTDKNTWLFSATMPKEIREIVHRYMNNPVEVSVSTGEKVNQNIEHRYALVKKKDKREALQRIIDGEGDMYALIFCRTKAETQALASQMADTGYPIEAIHGDLSQAQRNTVMRKFKSGHIRLLAATDVAARGIDVDNLSHVVHYDMPDDLAFYTHRSGRTARAGKKGVAIALVTPSEQYRVRQLEKQLNIRFNRAMIPSAEEVVMKHVQARLEDLLVTEATDDARIWVHSFGDQLESVSKEELLAKLLSQAMKGFSKQGADLNAYDHEHTAGNKDKHKGPRHKGERYRNDQHKGDHHKGEQEREGGMQRFSINLGIGDRLQKGDLLKIICDASGVRSKHIGKIQMFKKHSTFDVSDAKSKSLNKAFKGLHYNGRKIQVNVD